VLDKVAFDSLSIEPAGRTGDRLEFAVPYLKALAIYLCSRLVVFLGTVFGKAYIALGNDDWLAGAQWYHRLLGSDSEWYKIIASEGYKYDGDPGLRQTVVFYPLRPTICRLDSEVLRIDLVDAMLLVADLATVTAVILLFKLVRERFDDRTALATVAMFFPSSVLLSAGLYGAAGAAAEVSFFLAIAQERLLAAALLAGLAVATRSSGIVLLPVLLWELWRCRSPRRFLIEAVPLSIIATSGLWLYIIYLGFAFSHPMAFADWPSGLP